MDVEELELESKVHSDVDLELKVDLEEGSDVNLDFEVGSDLDFEVDTDVDLEVDTDVDFEVGSEVNLGWVVGLDVDLDFEMGSDKNLELEVATGVELFEVNLGMNLDWAVHSDVALDFEADLEAGFGVVELGVLDLGIEFLGVDRELELDLGVDLSVFERSDLAIEGESTFFSKSMRPSELDLVVGLFGKDLEDLVRDICGKSAILILPLLRSTDDLKGLVD